MPTTNNVQDAEPSALIAANAREDAWMHFTSFNLGKIPPAEHELFVLCDFLGLGKLVGLGSGKFGFGFWVFGFRFVSFFSLSVCFSKRFVCFFPVDY